MSAYSPMATGLGKRALIAKLRSEAENTAPPRTQAHQRNMKNGVKTCRCQYCKHIRWHSAIEMRKLKWSYPGIAAALGINHASVEYICKPEYRAKKNAQSKAWLKKNAGRVYIRASRRGAGT